MRRTGTRSLWHGTDRDAAGRDRDLKQGFSGALVTVYLLVHTTRRSFQKDELFHPPVAFCHDCRRKVTAAEIRSSR